VLLSYLVASYSTGRRFEICLGTGLKSMLGSNLKVNGEVSEEKQRFFCALKKGLRVLQAYNEKFDCTRRTHHRLGSYSIDCTHRMHRLESKKYCRVFDLCLLNI